MIGVARDGRLLGSIEGEVMAKRKTKEQREAEQYDALRQRVLDICAGATYGEIYEIETEQYPFCATDLSRIVMALRRAFLCEEEGKHNCYLFVPIQLNHYETVETITDFLFEHGVRA